MQGVNGDDTAFYVNNIKYLAYNVDLAILALSLLLTQNKTTFSVVGSDQL